MNKNTKIVLTLLALGLVFACKESAASEEANYAEEAATDSTSVVSSSAAVENKNSNRKFVRTADVKFKVKNVAKSTYAIEDATTKFGGFVTYTNLQSNIHNEDRTKVSQDSTLVTTKYKVDNKNYRYLPVKGNKVFIFFIGFCVNRKKIQHVDEVVKNIYSTNF